MWSRYGREQRSPYSTTEAQNKNPQSMTGDRYYEAHQPVDLFQVRAQIPVLQGDVMMNMVAVREH